MIDTIKGYINITNKIYSDFEHLFINEIKYIKNDGYIISTYVSNFKITIKFDNKNIPYKLYFYGSLPKFFFGNNLSELDEIKTHEAIQMLSDNLNLEMCEAIITRVDFGFNFILKNPISHYTNSLLRYSRLGVLRYPDSVTFLSKKTKAVTFYDKGKEIRAHKDGFKSIPKKFQRKYILRYEIRLKSDLNNKLEVDSLKMKDLSKDKILNKLLLLWYYDYNKVEKLLISVDPLHLINKRNGLFKYLSFHGLVKISYERVINILSSIDFDVKNQSVKRSKMIHPLKELLKEVNSHKLDENIMSELDNKIELIKELIFIK